MFKSDKQRQQLAKKDSNKIQKDPGSSTSTGGAFVVKRPAHLRSAVANKDVASMNNSPSIERLSSPIRAVPSGVHGDRSAPGRKSLAADRSEANRLSSHTLVVVFPSLQEFVRERHVLRNVLVDLQQYFCEMDLELECCTLFEMEDVLQNVEEYLLLGELLQLDNTTALVFIGDRYGDALLPLELRTEEYNAIREAALELADMDATLLDHFYVLDRGSDSITETGRAAEYQLKASRDPAGAQRLRQGLSKCVNRVFEEDGGSLAGQVNSVERKRHLLKSFIELCADAAEANAHSMLITRRFQSTPSTVASSQRWMDPEGSEAAERVNTLKNTMSARLDAHRHLPFIVDLKGTEPATWCRSRDAAIYEEDLSAKLTDRLKALILAAHPHCEQPHHPPLGEPRLAAMHIVQTENAIHASRLLAMTPKEWVPREGLDNRLAGIVLRVLDEEQTRNKGLFVQLFGPPGSGKTAALCHLFRMVRERKEKEGRPGPIVLARFAHLSDGAVFANEMLRNAFLTVCDEMQSPLGVLDAFLGAFHLSDVLGQAKALLERPNALPVLILIDDAHLLRFGRALGRMEHDLRKMLPRLSIVCTSTSAQPMAGFPRTAELIELIAPGVDQALTILTGTSSTKRRCLGADQMGILRQQLQRGEPNLILGGIQRDELLAGHSEVSISLDERLERAEQRCGADNVRLVCQFLCCGPCGITQLEVLDAVRLRNFTAGFTFEPKDVLNAAPLHVLRQLAPLLDSTVMDRRRVIFFRHHSVAQAAQQRYLHSAGEIKLANEALASLFRDSDAEKDTGAGSEEPTLAAMVFPHPIAKEGGLGVDIRRARFHWYYLLYTGNVEALKTETLCHFDYLEAAFRVCGLARLLSIFEECLNQILDHDLLVIFEQVLLPGITTLVREPRQFVSEFLNRLRYTRSKNSAHLNVLQAMQWTDNYSGSSLLVPLTCWIPPPKMKQVLSFTLSQWKSSKSTILQPTHNHQHLLVAGNELAPSCVYMFHIASQLLVRTFSAPDQTQVSSLCASKWRELNGELPSANPSNAQQNHFFVSTSIDGSVRVWSFSQAECLKTLQAGSSRILCSVLSNDDQWMVTGSADSCARVLYLDSGQVTRTFRDHTGMAINISHVIETCPVHTNSGPVVGVQLSSDNALLVTGSGDFAVMVWDIEQAQIVIRLQGLMAPVTCLALTSNDAFLAVACEDETLRVFSLVSAQELHELTGHESRINALVASADDCKLFAGTRGRVLVYDIHNGQLLEILQCMLERQAVSSIRISDDDSFVLVACGDRIHMWALDSIERDVAAVQQQQQREQHKQQITEAATDRKDSQQASTSVSCVQIAPDEKGAGCGTVDGIVAFWDLDVCQCMWTSSQQRSGTVTALCFSADSFMLLSGTQQGSVSLWETSNGQLLRKVQLHAEPVTALCTFADGVRVLSSDSNDNAYLWSLAALEESGAGKKVELITSIAHMQPPLYVRLSDTVLIAQHGANQKEMNVWSLSGDRLFTRSKVHHNEAILCYCVNRCGNVLCTGSRDLSLKLWQMDRGGLLIQVLVGHEDVPTCCCVSEDALVAVSGARDKLLIIWDVHTGTALRQLPRVAMPRFLEISLDGSVACMNGDDGWIEAIHTRTGRLLSAFNTHRQVEQLIMGADGDRILAKLAGTAQLPIICLHNTPANLHTASASRYERVLDSPSTSAKKTTGPGPMTLEISPTTGSDDGPEPLGDKVAGGVPPPNNEADREEPVTSRAGDLEQQAKRAELENAQKNAEEGTRAKNSTAEAPPATSGAETLTGANSQQEANGAQQKRTRRSKLCTVM